MLSKRLKGNDRYSEFSFPGRRRGGALSMRMRGENNAVRWVRGQLEGCIDQASSWYLRCPTENQNRFWGVKKKLLLRKTTLYRQLAGATCQERSFCNCRLVPNLVYRTFRALPPPLPSGKFREVPSGIRLKRCHGVVGIFASSLSKYLPEKKLFFCG